MQVVMDIGQLVDPVPYRNLQSANRKAIRLCICLLVALLLPPFSYGDCAKEAEVAVKFMNQYLVYIQAVTERNTQQGVIGWLASNPLVAPGFVVAYRAMEQEGWKNDPELGVGSDMILDAQDSPDRGFNLSKCSNIPGFVQLQGIDWPEFNVTVRVSAGQVIGAGMVNIPQTERAER